MRLFATRPFGVRRAFRRVATAVVLGLLAAGPGTTAVAGAAVPASAPAAGTYQQIANFGANPGNLTMYTYTPANLPAGAPLVLALHGCTQTANDYHTRSGWQKYADLWGFAVVYPQTGAANNSLSCFNWFDPADDTRGRGEAASVRQMVTDALSRYGSDSRRVFLTGISAGGGMAADLLAAYPDVFAGGSIVAGLPAQCATSVSAASVCQSGGQRLTPAQWGDKVRASYPGHTGPWPRVAIWHGASDTTVVPANATALRDQWTDVWGISATPSSTASLPGGTTRTTYDDSAGRSAVELYSVAGMGHGLAVNPGSGTEQCGATGAYFLNSICSSYYTAKFWGLDGTPPGEDPGTLPAPTGLRAGATTDTTVSLSWSAVAGAVSYELFRDGARAGSATTTAFTDTGLAPATAHTYTVAAVDTRGTPGARSAPVTATTTGSRPECFTDSNYGHVTAGRAHRIGGYAYANGSEQNMGLYNVFVRHTLARTAANHYVIADAGCPA